MKRWLILPVGVLLLSGCNIVSSTPSGDHNTTPTSKTAQPLPTPPTAHKTPAPSTPTPHRVALSSGYRRFIHSVCHGFATRNAQSIVNDLPYYQYNQGVYNGTFNRGEGQMGSTSLIGQWLSGGRVRCVRFAPSQAGHGVLVARGWPVDGGWGLVEFDKFNNAWKINDFTFGRRGQVMHAFFSTVPASVIY